MSRFFVAGRLVIVVKHEVFAKESLALDLGRQGAYASDKVGRVEHIDRIRVVVN